MPSLPRPALPMSPTDSMFLVAEKRTQPMHTGLLMLFEPGPDGPPDMAAFHARLLAATDIGPLFRKRARRTLGSGGQWFWETEPEIELEHHLRRSGLPAPGRPRELLELTGRLHSTLLDPRRPLWESHLIEGVSQGRWAVYSKVHHALIDGVSGLRLLTRSLSEDPDARDLPAPWETVERPRRRPVASGHEDDRGPGPVARAAGALPGQVGAVAGAVASTAEDVLADTAGRVGDVAAAVADAVGIVPAMARAIRRGIAEQAAALPYTAPRTILNVEITSSRRFAADSWDLDRLRAVAKASSGSINDVVLGMCSGALRTWLGELDALPDAPLVGMVPMSLREDDSAEGNAVGAIMANLGTDLTTAGARLERVHESVAAAKRSFAGLSQAQALALSMPGVAAFALDRVVPGAASWRPPFNLVISNVPGPREQLYWEGSALRGLYPLSIPLDGQAMNITVVSNHDQMGFGIVGCRRSAPHLQRLLTHLETELAELEQVYA